LHESLVKFYQTADKYKEAWGGHYSSPNNNAITHLNHWKAPSQFFDVNDDKLRTYVWDETQSIMEQWSGVKLSPSSFYGRVYTNQSIITPHVDAEPLVLSAILCIEQDVTEPWVLEMIGHDGKAYNVSLVEGEMLLYEGASVIHGRPYSMNGVYAVVSNVFYFKYTVCS
jgi:prolyl 4-hydroxylase